MDIYCSLIHTVLENLGFNDQQVSSEIHKFMHTDVPIGSKFPLYGVCRNNFAEGMALMLKSTGIRYMPPPKAIRVFLHKSRSTLKKFSEQISTLNSEGRVCSCIGLGWWTMRGAVCFEIVENESIFAGGVEMDLPLEAMLRM